MNLVSDIEKAGLWKLDHLYPAQTAFFFPLSRRGFFSEMNMLVKAFAFAILSSRHIFVQADRMNVEWNELFDTRFLDYTAYGPQYTGWEFISIKKAHRLAYERMRDAFSGLARSGEVVSSANVGFKGSLEQLIAQVSQALFAPSARVLVEKAGIATALGLEPGGYTTFHVRGGDKIDGVVSPDGTLKIEGEVSPQARYMELREKAGVTGGKVLVITDSYRTFKGLAAAYPHVEFVTSCPPEAAGYYHDQYVEQDMAERTEEAVRLIAEVALAAESDVFVGPYLSNVSTFIHQLRGDRPSFSVDSQENWYPH